MGFAFDRLRVSLVKPSELTASQITQWKLIAKGNVSLDNPQLQPEFALAIERVGRPVEVAIIEADSSTVAFFPFSRVTATKAEPIGGITSDYEALIVASNTQLDMVKVLRACGLTRWSFSHLDAAQSSLFAGAAYFDDCYSANLEFGYGGYLETVREKHKNWLNDIGRKARKLAREEGELRYQWQDPHADEAIAMFCDWKRKQLQAKGFSDMFRQRWVESLFSECVRHKSPEFRLIVSTLRAGKSLCAVHLGLCSQSMFLSWMPSFNQDLGHYSPGAHLFLNMAETAASEGVLRLDFGRGENPTKRRLATYCYPLAIGRITTSPLASRIANQYLRAKRVLGRSSFLRRLRRDIGLMKKT